MLEQLRCQLREAGTPADQIEALVELAQSLAEQRGVAPDPVWLMESRERLLERFDRERQSDPDR